jgi:hypothetical protein
MNFSYSQLPENFLLSPTQTPHHLPHVCGEQLSFDWTVMKYRCLRRNRESVAFHVSVGKHAMISGEQVFGNASKPLILPLFCTSPHDLMQTDLLELARKGM